MTRNAWLARRLWWLALRDCWDLIVAEMRGRGR
jgi:hypothetical protein